MDKTLNTLLMIAVISAVTLALRALPFVIFSEKRPVPTPVKRLSAVLPCAVMGMLVVYCLRGMDFTVMPFGLPEICASAVVAGSYIRKRKTLLSILLGTGVYMLLIRIL